MRSRLVAETSRKSTLTGLRAPTGSISPSCIARSSLTCASSGKLADLVEEQRAADRLDELAGMPFGRAGEGAFFVAEQDRLDEVVGDRAAIDGDERLGARSPVPWMARAISSLPTPDSPSIRTGMSEPAAFSASAARRACAGLRVRYRGRSACRRGGA